MCCVDKDLYKGQIDKDFISFFNSKFFTNSCFEW
jgi:hypothetical protein